MVKAVRIHETGGPQVLRYEEIETPVPGAGEVLLRQTAIGLNYIDIGMRRGAFAFKSYPVILGMEGAGVIEALGAGVSGFKVGDRVSHCMVVGSYAEKRTIAANRLIALPDKIADEVAAAATLQGLTAQYLLHGSYALQPGETILVQAAAGGMGLLLCQWAKEIGATVIGTVSSEEKAAVARAHGCDHAINYSTEDFVARVAEITGGKGVRAVYDAIGKDTFAGGLACLAPRGHMVSYGQASGPVPPLDIATLGAKSLTVTRGALGVYVADPVARGKNAALLWDMIADGRLRIEINQRYRLADIATAHADLEGRRTTGASVLTP